MDIIESIFKNRKWLYIDGGKRKKKKYIFQFFPQLDKSLSIVAQGIVVIFISTFVIVSGVFFVTVEACYPEYALLERIE